MLEAFSATFLFVHLVSDGRLAIEGMRVPASEAARRVVNFMAEIPLDERTLSGRAASQKTTVLSDFAAWPEDTRELAKLTDIRYGIATPLLAGDRVLGTISMARADDRAFTRDDTQLLESCATHLGAVVDHARLFDEEHRRARDLSLMNELGAIIAQHLDIKAVLDIGVRHAARIARVQNAFFMVLDEKKQSLRTVASAVEESEALVIPKNPDSLAWLAVLEGKPMVTDDAGSDPRASAALRKRYKYRAVLCVPVFAEGKPLGALVLGDSRADRRFLPSEIETAVAVGNQLATAVANAHLFEDLRRSYEKLEQTQEQLIRQERLAALGELAAVMAHEVRNPLAIIFNAIASLRKIPHPRADARTLIGIVAEEAEQLNRIVGDLLDFARPHEPIFRPEPLDAIVHAALESAKGAERARGIEFVADIEIMPPVHLDARMFKQALINLIVNAIQALPNGGRIVVRARRLEGDTERTVEVSVIDDGPGIAPDLRGRVFQPFFTTKASGTGLGLAIVKRIAETHQGEVTVESTPGVGTTSTLRLSIDRVRTPL
jgi:signal transduction histidine kinase